MATELLVVKVPITLPAKANFGNVRDAIKPFVGKKAQQIYSICVMIVGMIFEF